MVDLVQVNAAAMINLPLFVFAMLFTISHFCVLHANRLRLARDCYDLEAIIQSLKWGSRRFKLEFYKQKLTEDFSLKRFQIYWSKIPVSIFIDFDLTRVRPKITNLISLERSCKKNHCQRNLW